MRGSASTRRTPHHFGPMGLRRRPEPLPCRRHILALLLDIRPARPSVRGNSLNRALSWIRTGAALAAVGIVVAGCAAANNATSAQASAQGEQSYKTMYGMSSDGPTTDLYTELFGPRQPAPAP